MKKTQHNIHTKKNSEHYFKIHNRLDLAKVIKQESNLVKNESIKVLSEFEILEQNIIYLIDL